jgi:hypothetical protein
VDWIQVAQDKVKWLALLNTKECSVFIKAGNLLTR